MTFNIQKELEATVREAEIRHKENFHDAVMKQEAEKLRTPEDWQQADEIIKRGKADRKQLGKDYVREYDTRVAQTRHRLIHEAGQVKFEHPAPYGRDKFDGEAITRQAGREVQLDHQNDLQASRDNEAREMENLQETARKRDYNKGILKEDFEKSNDRRQQRDIQGPKRSR